MLGLIPVVVALALVDSINPSAIGMTIYLMLSRADYRTRVASYLAGVFCTYLAIGCLLVLGLDVLSDRFRDVWYSSAAYVVSGTIGALMLAYSFLAPAEKPPRRSPTGRGHAGLFLLGAGISAVEFSTALPYFGAIALIIRSDLAVPEWLPLMVLYNVVMALPPIALVVAYTAARDRWQGRLERWRERMQSGARNTWLWVIGIIGALLLLDSLSYFDFFGLVELDRTTPAG